MSNGVPGELRDEIFSSDGETEYLGSFYNVGSLQFMTGRLNGGQWFGALACLWLKKKCHHI